MPSNIDPTIMNRDGPIPKSAARSPAGLPGVQEQLATAKDEIDGLQGGATIDFSGLTNSAPDLDSKFIFRGTSATRYATLSQLRDTSLSGRILTAPGLGITGDGVATDDAAKLNQAIATWSALGGAYMLLRPADNGFFLFNQTIFLRSNVILQFIGPPIRMTAGASFILNGQLALSPSSNRFRLLANTTAGDTTMRIDTAPQGGGPLSNYFSVNDHLVIDGLVDSAGNSFEYQEVRVTGINDGTETLTITPGLSSDFAVIYTNSAYESFSGQVNRTLVSKQVQTLLNISAGVGDRILTVASATVGQFSAGDFVHAMDDELSGGEPANLEPARIVGVEIDGDNTITLDRSVQHPLTTGNLGRLVKLDPIAGAGVFGASIVYTEAATDIVHPFEMRRAAGCTSGECQLTNADVYGYKGNGFRIWGSIACRWDDIQVLNPKHLAEGEGVAACIAYSRDCYISKLYATGCRRDGYAVGSTNATFQEIESVDNYFRSLGTAGLRERGTIFTNFRLSGGGNYASSSKAAISIGSALYVAGSFDTSIYSGKIMSWGGSSTYATEIHAPSEDAFFDSVEVQDCAVGFHFSDHPLNGALLAFNARFQNCIWNNIQSWIVDADGGRNGSSDYTLHGLQMSGCHFVAVSKMFKIKQIDTFKLIQPFIDQIQNDTTEPYIVKATDIVDLLCYGGICNKPTKGLSLTDCPDFRVLGVTIADLVGSTVVLFDGGGNDGGHWRLVDAAGFTPTADLSGGSSITFHPFPIGGDYLTDS